MASSAASYDSLVSKMQRKQKRNPSWAGLAAEYAGAADEHEKPVSVSRDVSAAASGITRSERKRMRRNAANEAKGLSAEEKGPAKARKGKAEPEAAEAAEEEAEAAEEAKAEELPEEVPDEEEEEEAEAEGEGEGEEEDDEVEHDRWRSEAYDAHFGVDWDAAGLSKRQATLQEHSCALTPSPNPSPNPSPSPNPNPKPDPNPNPNPSPDHDPTPAGAQLGAAGPRGGARALKQRGGAVLTLTLTLTY